VGQLIEILGSLMQMETTRALLEYEKEQDDELLSVSLAAIANDATAGDKKECPVLTANDLEQ